QSNFILEQANKIMPRWIREVLSGVFAASVSCIAYLVTEDVERTIILVVAFFLVHLLWQKCFVFLRRKRTARYLESLPNSENWSCEIRDGLIVSENRGLTISFPLASLTRVFEADGF